MPLVNSAAPSGPRPCPLIASATTEISRASSRFSMPLFHQCVIMCKRRRCPPGLRSCPPREVSLRGLRRARFRALRCRVRASKSTFAAFRHCASCSRPRAIHVCGNHERAVGRASGSHFGAALRGSCLSPLAHESSRLMADAKRTMAWRAADTTPPSSRTILIPAVGESSAALR